MRKIHSLFDRKNGAEYEAKQRHDPAGVEDRGQRAGSENASRARRDAGYNRHEGEAAAAHQRTMTNLGGNVMQYCYSIGHSLLIYEGNGRGGIRTHGGLPHARFRVECLKPDSATLPKRQKKRRTPNVQHPAPTEKPILICHGFGL